MVHVTEAGQEAGNVCVTRISIEDTQGVKLYKLMDSIYVTTSRKGKRNAVAYGVRHNSCRRREMLLPQ